MMTLEKMIGMRIKNMRRRRNETQQQLGEATGVVQQSVAAWESGRCMPSVISIIRIAEHYNVTTDSVLGIDSNLLGTFSCNHI